MKENERYLISLDLDDTLLTTQKTITEKTKAYLHHLRNEGHVVVINTGRPPKAFCRYYKELGLDTPYAAINGSIVCHPSEPRFPGYEHSFCRDSLLSLVHECGGESAFLDLACGNDQEMNFMNHSYEQFLAFEEEGMTIHRGDFLTYIPEKTDFFFLQPKDKEIKRRLDGFLSRQEDMSAHFYGGEFMIGELYHPSVSKGIALDDLADYYQIPKERVISFGDSQNDREMLLHSGIGVLMKNGDMNLKESSTMVSLEDNDHDGVVKTLEFLLNQKASIEK